MPDTVKVWTRNSVYEVDPYGARVRRLEGVNDPTPRQGPDGLWRHYKTLEQVDGTLLFVWGFTADGVARTTQTSTILEIS